MKLLDFVDSAVVAKDVINDQGGRVSLMWKPSYMEGAPSYLMMV